VGTKFTTVAHLVDLPPTGGLQVTVQGRRIAIFKTEAGIFATDAECPHRGGPLSAGWVENGKVYCPLHGWEFDLRTGVCRANSERPITCFPIRISGDEVQVGIEEESA
jgi:nitrite reductase (NADH) small subunit